jgi:RecA-family ATPase
MDNADRLACIGHDVSLAAPGEKLRTFVDRADTFGKLVRKGFFSAAALEQKLWDVARAYNLSGSPGSESEEYVADVIDKAVAIDDEPRANGHDRDPPLDGEKPAIIEPLETIDPADWDGHEPPERRWIIRNLIPLGEAGLLNGHGGAGKTLLGCQLAVAVNMTADCVGFAVEHGGPVLLYSAEERQEELHRRLAVILESRNKRLADLKGFRIYCPPPTETMLTTVGRDGIVRPTMTMLRLEKTIETLRPVLVTIDHVSIAFGGSEIDRSIVGQNVGFMKRMAGICGSAVLGFQHVSFSGLNSDEGSSGSTQWHNAARARMWLRGMKDDETSELRELVIKKQNYGKDGQKHLLRWQKPGLFVPVGTPSLVERASEEAKVDSAYLDCLRAIDVQGRRVGPYTGKNYAPAIFESMPQARGCQGKAFTAAQERLFASGKIEAIQVGSPSKQVTIIKRKEAEQ